MSSECAEAASAIGRILAREALWHRGRCNWVGPVADATDPWRIQFRALGIVGQPAIDWQNRPTFQQVVTLTRSLPR